MEKDQKREDDFNIEIAHHLQEAIGYLRAARTMLTKEKHTQSVFERAMLEQIGHTIKETEKTFIMHCNYANIDLYTVD